MIFRKRKFENGIYNYVDTSFKGEAFVVKDTITEIRVDHAGKGYIVFWRVKNNSNVKGYFENGGLIDSVMTNEVVIVSSSQHAAKTVTPITEVRLHTVYYSLLVAE